MQTPPANPPSGFTILELLVAIVILSILAAVAVPNFSRAVERARVRDAQSILATLFEAERMYRLDNNRYGTLVELVNGRYLTNPNPTGPIVIFLEPQPQFPQADWVYGTLNESQSAFTGRATRNRGGGYRGMTVEVNQAFNGRVYGGNHPLRDR